MIKIWCDFCNEEIRLEEEAYYSFSVELDPYNDKHVITGENFPTPYNKTFCLNCHDALIEKFNYTNEDC